MLKYHFHSEIFICLMVPKTLRYILKNSFTIVTYSLFVLIGMLFSMPSYSQTTDLGRIEYTFLPQSNSKNSINRFRAFVNYPIKLKWDESYLIPGVEYRNFDLDIKDPVPFDIDHMGKFEMFRASLAVTFKMGKDWRFAVKGGAELASNFERSSITQHDVNFTGAVFLVRSKSGEENQKPSRFIIGLNYSTNAGRPFPIPIINYYKKFHPNWSYSIGSPKTNLKYFWNAKNNIQGFITLDGFYSNIQNNRSVLYPDGSSASADNISMTIVLGGLGYEHNFTKHLVFYAYGGRTFYNEIRLRDTKLNNLYVLNEENTFYIRTGIKFKL